MWGYQNGHGDGMTILETDTNLTGTQIIGKNILY